MENAKPIILSGGTCHVLQDEWPSQRFRPCIFFLYIPNFNWLFEVCVVIPYWLHYYSLLSPPRLGLVTTQVFFCFVLFGFLLGFFVSFCLTFRQGTDIFLDLIQINISYTLLWSYENAYCKDKEKTFGGQLAPNWIQKLIKL